MGFRLDDFYGKVPARWLPYNGEGGSCCWVADPDYRPALPPGAIRGDVSKQIYCKLCHVPRYYYVDAQRECVQCGKAFVFSAREQKYWYETLHFHFDSTAIRCAACRRLKRSERGVQVQLFEATSNLRGHEADPGRLLDFARAVVALREMCGEGKVADAIAACRKARACSSEAVAAWYWEGRCHALAGRAAKARDCFERFLEAANGDARYEKLTRDAERRRDERR